MKLYLLRHGETDWNVTWRLQGSSDIPLNEKGIAQAREAAARYAGYPFTAVFSSPLQRAVTTAELIAAPHGLTVKTDERLTEMNFGTLEGTTPEESALDPVLSDVRTKLFDDPPAYIPAGNGETYPQVRERCRSFLEELHRQFGEQDHILVSAHGALCKALLWTITDAPLSEFWHTPPQPNCSVIEIDW